MSETLGLLKLLPEGVSVVSVMITFVIGIKYVKFLHATHKADKSEMMDAHEKQVAVLLGSHREERVRFAEILDNSQEAHKELLAPHNARMERHLKVSGDVVTAVDDLRKAVVDLQLKVK